MAFNVNLYSLEKRDNSTKRPTGNGTQYSCVMKHGCGILNPSISLDIGLTTNPSQYNYAYIPAFGRYYFIDEWFFEERLWTAQLKVDVLATYKTEIGNASLYVLRSSAEYNGNVTDLLYPSKVGCNFSTSTKTNPWTGVSYVIGVINKYASFGSLQYLVVDSATLSSICTYLMSPTNIINTTNGFNGADASEALQLSLVDPIQYIKSCIMIPVNVGDYTSLAGDTRIYCYNWQVGNAFGRPLYSSTRIYKSYSFSIPKHPDTNARGNYVNSAPYTALTLTIPPFGCIDIDTTVSANASTLDIEIEVDPISGKGVLVVKCNDTILNRLETMIGVSISLSTVTKSSDVSMTTLVKSAVGAVGGAISAGANAVGIGWGASIGNSMQASTARAQTIGSTGAFVSNRGEFRLDAQFFRPVADDNTHNGRPLCAVRTLSTLPGYQLIQDGDVSIDGTSKEDGIIRDYLESGYYYE